jgi:hypothetical protein
MKNEFCTYKQSLALKELGFDEPCLAYYNKKELFSFPQICNEPLEGHYIKMSNRLCTPLKQQAFRWFREKYKLSYPSPFYQPQDNVYYNWTSYPEIIWDVQYKTYEEAESACLDKLIEIVKNK